MLHGFVRVSLCIFRPLPNKSKLKFDQDFNAVWSFCSELKVFIESVINVLGPVCLWQCFWREVLVTFLWRPKLLPVWEVKKCQGQRKETTRRPYCSKPLMLSTLTFASLRRARHHTCSLAAPSNLQPAALNLHCLRSQYFAKGFGPVHQSSVPMDG